MTASWFKKWKEIAPIRYKNVRITSAEILALNATPKELVAAPGAGRAIEFVSAALFLDYGAATYTGNGTLIVEAVTGPVVLSGVLPAASLLHKAADGFAVMAPLSTGIDLVVNDAIELKEPTGECTVGDGTLTVRVGYRVHSFIDY